jgi:D-alanyl-D-alanine carboxypeptidase
MKKFFTILLSSLIIFSNINLKVMAKDAEPTVSAEGAILMDATTGEILYSKNMNAAFPPASTTKIMTALLALEKCSLDDIVTVKKNPPNADGSKIYLFEGEQLTVRDLLYGLMLPSANDCAEALAEHISGSVDEFAKLMNTRAKELGCENTNFVNPSGLYNDKHRTSAKDLALIMRQLSSIPEYKTIATTLSTKIAPTNKSKDERPLWNENKLMQKNTRYYYDGIIGGKTGYTVQSEHSYVAAAERNGQRLVVALVHDKNKTFFEDSVNLFNYGFKNYKLEKLFSKGAEITKYSSGNLSIPLIAGEDFYYVKEKNSTEVPTYTIPQANLSDRSFKTGDTLMETPVTFNSKQIGNLKLASGIDHEIKSAFNFNSQSKTNNTLMYFIIPGIAIVLLMSIFIIRYKRVRKN